MRLKNLVFIGWMMPVVALAGCATGGNPPVSPPPGGYRQAMRSFIENLSTYARSIDPGFLVIPQNGGQLLTVDGRPDGAPDQGYLQAISGVGREDLFYGYSGDNRPTPVSAREQMLPFLTEARRHGKTVLVIDYCSTPASMADSYARNGSLGFVSFAADRRALDDIPSYPPQPNQVNSADISRLSEVKNFLYLINPQNYTSADGMLQAIRATNYDLVFVDLFFGDRALTRQQVDSLKRKANGGRRLVIAYMSIGEAEDYRYYWQPFWQFSPPSWLGAENPNWPGNYKVHYWDPGWQAMIYGNNGSYLKRILDAGFDGVYLDVVDAYDYYENL